MGDLVWSKTGDNLAGRQREAFSIFGTYKISSPGRHQGEDHILILPHDSVNRPFKHVYEAKAFAEADFDRLWRINQYLKQLPIEETDDRSESSNRTLPDLREPVVFRQAAE